MGCSGSKSDKYVTFGEKAARRIEKDDSCEGAAKEVVKKVLASYQGTGKVIKAARATAAESPAVTEVLKLFLGWKQFFVDKFRNEPEWAETFTYVDDETKAAFESAGLDVKSFHANSVAYWGKQGSDSEIKQATIGMFDAINTACEPSYKPTSKQGENAKYIILGWLVRLMFIWHRGHNFGAVVLKDRFDEKGKPVMLIRCQTMADAGEKGSAFRKLAESGVVDHFCNLYNGHFPLQDMLDTESKICADMRKKTGRHVPTYLDERVLKKTRKWRRMVDEQHEWADDTQRNNAMALCASQIKDILNPGGHPPEGSILIHCAGGMHRTGMLFALIRRYVNDDPIEDILDEYKRHVAWVDAGTPGGFEELNEKFIREFDLSLIDAEDIVFENGFELDEDLDDANGISWGPGSFTKMLK